MKNIKRLNWDVSLCNARLAFTLAEMMVVLLIMSIIMAAMAPVMTTKSKTERSTPWKWSSNTSPNAYFGVNDTQTALIGQRDVADSDEASKFVINAPTGTNHILFKEGDSVLGKFRFTPRSGLMVGSLSSGSAEGTGTITYGVENTISTSPSGLLGNYNILLGRGLSSSGNAGIAIGIASGTYGDRGIAIGSKYGSLPDETTADADGIAIGTAAHSTGSAGIALGLRSKSASDGISIGADTNSTSYGVAIGANARIKDYSPGIALGRASSVPGQRSIAVGYSASTDGDEAIAIGPQAGATKHGIAIGTKAKAAEQGIAIGVNGASAGRQSIAIGRQSSVKASLSIAIGWDTDVKEDEAIAIGTKAKAAKQGIAIGVNGASAGRQSIAIGHQSKAEGLRSGAIGWNVQVPSDKQDYIQIGRWADSTEGMKDTTVRVPILLANKVMAKNENPKNGGSYSVEADIVTAKRVNYGELYQSSDRRLKNVDGEYTSGLDKIRQIKPFNYTYKKDTEKTPRVGVIAQDLQKIFPNAVKKGQDGFLTIRQEEMFYAVINAIKELDAKLNEILHFVQNDMKNIQADNKKLRDENAELKKIMKQIQNDNRNLNKRLDALEKRVK